MVKLKAVYTGLEDDEGRVCINKKDASSLGLNMRSRVLVKVGDNSLICKIFICDKIVNPGEIGITTIVEQKLEISEGEIIEVFPSKAPKSLDYILKNLKGASLTREEIYAIVSDIVNRNLTNVELTAFILTQYFKGFSMEEIESLTRAMAETGLTIDFEEPVYDKHSIGGVPGNKVSLLIVPIVAASGLPIPKTSSRAITSPSGTADTMEVLAPVEFTAEELKEIVKKVRGCLAWGGTLNIAPADDILIENVEHPLDIDPISQMLASIMSKKLAVGVDSLVLDIPVGKGAKVQNNKSAIDLSRKFVELGARLGIRVETGLTYGGQPIGHAVGPALEAKEALEALMGLNPSTSLVEKSTSLAGILLEMAGLASRGRGQSLARKILDNGSALKKMKEIIEAQGGNPEVKPEDIPLGNHVEELYAPASGYIVEVSNKAINAIARAAGAPDDKGAGVYLYKKRGGYVKKGEPILKIYAETASKARDALAVAMKRKPITIEGMLLKRISSFY
ncbi:MAG: AMP phosphorylase [Candidatus Odinarchaeia archaeon]